MSVPRFTFDAQKHFTRKCSANIVRSLSMSLRQTVDYTDEYLGNIPVRPILRLPVEYTGTVCKTQKTFQDRILAQSMRGEVTIQFATHL
jgi:hypothetical protein